MKHIIFASLIMSLSSLALAAPKKCVLEVKDFITLPNGPVDFPTASLATLKEKGYSPKITDYPSSKPGTYHLSSKVNCLGYVLNPWLTNCTATLTIYDADATFMAQGTSALNMGFGAFSIDLGAAVRDLPDCKDLK